MASGGGPGPLDSDSRLSKVAQKIAPPPTSTNLLYLEAWQNDPNFLTFSTTSDFLLGGGQFGCFSGYFFKGNW